MRTFATTLIPRSLGLPGLMLMLGMSTAHTALHAQPDAYGLSAPSSSKWLTVSQTTGLGTLQNLPTPGGANTYTGAAATRSQMVRRNDQGDILFFAVDGNVYDGAGYLMADTKGIGCQECVDPGIMEFISVPVPGSCTKFYLLAAVAHTFDPEIPAHVQVGVLDLEASNPHHLGRRGALMLFYGPGFNAAFPNWAITTEGSGYMGRLASDPVNAKCTSPIIRVVRSGTGANAHSWLFMALSDYLYVYKITADGIDPVNTYGGLPYVPLNNTASPAITKQYVRDADVFRNGSVISFAMVDNAIFKPLPSYATTGDLITLRFSNSTGALVSGSVAVHTVGAVGGSGSPATGGVGGLSGCVFGTDANTLWISGNYWTGSTWVPRIGTFSISTGVLTDRSNLIPSLGNYVNSRMYRNRAPDGGSEAIYFPTSTSVGVLSGIGTPTAAAFNATGIAAPAPVLSTPEPNLYFPPFFNEGVVGENFLTHFTSATCCTSRQGIGAVHGYTMNTSNTFAAPWQPGSHPFGGGSTIVFTQDLVVPSGKRLYLKDLTLRFAANARLVIQQGGYVHTRNTRLTAYDCSNARWLGVRILGTYTMPQTTDLSPVNQGRMELTSTSVIENAQVGVQVGTDATIPFYVLASGGILNADNSSFVNCRESVRMHPYQNFQVGNPAVLLANRTSFRKTTFTVNADYPAPYDFQHHAYLNHVSGIGFNECHFKNERSDALFSGMGSLQLGHGIRSLDAEFKVLPGCTVPPQQGQSCAAPNVIRSTFIGLDHGIHALVATTTRAFEVDRAQFTDNICGVYTVSTIGNKITNNNFSLGGRNVAMNNDQETGWESHRRGVYTFESSGFAIDYNALYRTSGSTQKTEGIVVSSSMSSNDYVFQNTATNLDIGFVGEGICASLAPSQTPTIGLQFICNTSSNTGINLWSRKVSALPNPNSHIIRSNQGESWRPADNVFDNWNTAANLAGKWDFKVTTTFSPISYWHRNTSGPYVPLNTPSVPSQHLMNPAQVSSIPGNNCGSKVQQQTQQPQGLMAAIGEEQEMYITLRYLHDGLIDQGNTGTVLAEIGNSWPQEAWALRSSMLAKSPYLSTEALVELVQHNTLPHALLAEVLIANPEGTKGEGFYKWLESEAPNPLPGYLLQQVRASWNSHTHRAELEWRMGDHHAALTQHVLALVQRLQADTLYEQVDSLAMAWHLLRTVNARYAEALTLAQQGRYADARAIVDQMAEEHKLLPVEEAERHRTLAYLTFVEGITVAGRSMAELTEAEIGQLTALRDAAFDRPGTWAGNILCFHYGLCRPIPSGGDGEGAKALTSLAPAKEASPATMRLYPNPSTAWTAIDLMLTDKVDNAYVRVLDATGRQMQQLNVAAATTQLVLDTRPLAPGPYLVELFNAGQRLGSEQLIVQP